jgi:hypothetical protein
MSTTMRAKLVVASVERFGSSEKVTFRAVSKTTPYDADGNDEDNTYAKFSPQADFVIHIANPALIGKFNPGEKYYSDFTPAD